jgi:flagellar M-ring protein FliF
MKVWMPYVRYAVGGVLFFLILFMVVRPLMVMLATSAPAANVGETPALPASVGQVEAAISGKQPSQILDMAKNNPANTAVVVKQWLKSNA